MAPTPKPPGQRRRRNAGQSQWRELPAEGRKSDPPPLPVKKPAWLKATREWWQRAWASPMAVAWLPSDYDALLRLAHMRDAVGRDQKAASLHSQITSLEDRLGLTPGARRKLQWEIKQAQGQEPAVPINARRLRAVE